MVSRSTEDEEVLKMEIFPRDDRDGRNINEEDDLADDAPFLEQLHIDETPNEQPHPYRRKTTVLAFVIAFFLELGSGILIPAWNSMLEDRICELYVPRPDGGASLADDPRCKVIQVQGALASLQGWQSVADCVPAIICAIPFGIMADRIGRKPVLSLACFGLFLQTLWYNVVYIFPQMPAWTVNLGAIFLFIGGFPSVGPSMVFTILADVTPQAERASAYFGVYAVFMLGELISNPIAGALLLLSTSITLTVGTVIFTLGTMLVVVLPETLTVSNKLSRHEDSLAHHRSDGSSKGSLMGVIGKATLENLKDVWDFVLGNGRIIILMLPVMFSAVGRFANDLLLQYATKRYSWTWSKAAFLMTVKSASNFVLCVAILPVISYLLLTRYNMNALAKDMLIARVSGIILTVGAILIGLSYTPQWLVFALIVNAMGTGMSAVLRSLLSGLIESHHTAILNTLLAIIEYAGVIVASPVLFGSLKLGLEFGGFWIGLPYFFAAIMFTFGTCIVFFFRLPPDPRRE